MRAKGQLSFDLFFAVIFAMVIAQQLLTISDQMAATSREISIRSQEEAIGNNLAAIIASTGALRDGTFSIEYTIPSIFDPKIAGAQSCDVYGLSAGSIIAVKYPYYGSSDMIETIVGFERPSGITITPSPPDIPKCGEKITISK